MGSVTDTGFVLQHVEKDKVQETSIPFAEVKSFRQYKGRSNNRPRSAA